MNHRINSLEEANEDCDLEALVEREQISAGEIVEELKRMKAELIQKTVSQADFKAIVEKFADVELV